MTPLKPAPKPSFWRALLLSVSIALLNVAMWTWLNRPIEVPDWPGKIAGFSYAPYQRYQNPNNGIYPTIEEIDADLKLLSKYTDRIRTYSALENPAIPAIAKKYGLKVTAGTYLDHRDQHDDDEIAALIPVLVAKVRSRRAMRVGLSRERERRKYEHLILGPIRGPRCRTRCVT